MHRLVGDDADDDAGEAREADDDVAREGGVHFEQFAVVDEATNDGLHVDRFRRVRRDQVVDALIRNAFDRRREVVRGVFGVVRRQEGQQMLDQGDGVLVVFGDEVGVAADRGVHFGAADFGHGRGAAGDGLDDFRTGEEHLRVLARHDDEVHQRRRVGGTASTGAADDGDLGDDAGEQDVGVEDVAVTGEGVNAFLDTGAAGVLEGDDRDADLDGVAHDAGDLARLHLAEAAGLDAEVLAEGGDLLVAEVARPRNDAVGGSWRPSMPKWTAWCSACMPISWKVPASNSVSMRSRADRTPLACIASSFSGLMWFVIFSRLLRKVSNNSGLIVISAFSLVIC